MKSQVWLHGGYLNEASGSNIMKVQFHLDKNKQPTTDNGMNVAYGNVKRGGYRVRWYLILALVLSPILVMGYYFVQQYVLTIAPGIITTEPLMLTAPQNSIVKSIKVQDGDAVAAQQLVIELQDPTLDQDIEFLRNELRTLNETLAHRKIEDFKPYIAAINVATKNVDKIATIKDIYEQYIKEGKVSQVDYAAIISLYSNAESVLMNANIALYEAQALAAKQKIVGGTAQLRRSLNQKLATKMHQYNALIIRSPFAGHTIDMAAIAGQRVSQGDVLAVIAPKVAPFVMTYLSPKYISKAALGSEVTVVMPNGKRVKAKVAVSTTVASKLPVQLTKPFEAPESLLKIKLTLVDALDAGSWVEGIPVKVSF